MPELNKFMEAARLSAQNHQRHLERTGPKASIIGSPRSVFDTQRAPAAESCAEDWKIDVHYAWLDRILREHICAEAVHSGGMPYAQLCWQVSFLMEYLMEISAEHEVPLAEVLTEASMVARYEHDKGLAERAALSAAK